MKTLDIFKKYESLYNEDLAPETETPEGDTTDVADATDTAEQPPAPESVSAEGEKFLADLLVKAFLHEPDASGAQTAVDLQARVEENPKEVIDAISSLVKIGEVDLKDTLAQA